MILHIDIETYSSVDITKSGAYKYASAPDFKVMLFGYAYADSDVNVVDLEHGETIPEKVLADLYDSSVIKTAFNANFEITCLNRMLNSALVTDQWECTMVRSYYLGLSGGLDAVAKALNLEVVKDPRGKALIKKFCTPDGKKSLEQLSLEGVSGDWEQFKEYCKRDVEVEKALYAKVSGLYNISAEEHKLWVLDQKINSYGIKVDTKLIANALECARIYSDKLQEQAKKISRLDNPKSNAQVKKWLSVYENINTESVTKDNIADIKSQAKDSKTKEFLDIYSELTKTSVSKYEAMTNALCPDGRVRGLLQFNGASRTARWAGRLIQVHNLPKNYISDLEDARELLVKGDYTGLDIMYPSIFGVLSELIRTAFIPKEGCRFVISDFSAIEARIIAWLANERWRLDVFNSHGKIYEASASAMFHVPIEEITKTSTLRQKGKVAELACGYQGGVGALKAMGALKMGVPEEELQGLIDNWRRANPKIVSLWKRVENAAFNAVERKNKVQFDKNIRFLYDKGNLLIRLPSGRSLCYLSALIETGKKFGNKVLSYKGMDQTTKQFTKIETYGGCLVENIVQAIARDCLATALTRIDAAGYNIVMHIHDEIVLEVSKDKDCMDEINEIMAEPIEWASGLPLKGDGFETEFYRKD